LDLASLQSVKDAAAKFSAESDRLDILLLNAGVMAIPPAVTEDGYEIQFGTNHVGHALLTKLLVPVLDKTAKSSDAGARIVSLGSYAHNYTATGGIDFESLKSKAENLSSYARYGQSKLACILFARQLAKEYPQFTSVSLHPGLVRTNLFHAATDSPAILRFTMPLWNYFLVTPEDGAKNQLWASVAKDVKNGEYYEPIGVPGRASSYGKNDELAKKLWDWTERELESYTI
jgi:NAD(P)-dependent dehydrogenase (short-subunit alcohol dehydrogenase family)